jgi:predicted nucleic acid-binding protein
LIVVDTSVWVEALRNGESLAGARLRSLFDTDLVALTAPVRMELLLGASRKQEPQLKRLLAALPCWYPDRDDWSQLEEWVAPALRAGQRFAVVDLLIAAVAYRHQARLWSLDSDFRRLAKLGFADLYQP